MLDQQQALLAAILANPGDDLPRLVYADWLEENERDEECVTCQGRGVHGARRYTPGKMWTCSHCSGSGRASNGFAARVEFIRVQVELAAGVHCLHCGSKGMIGNSTCRHCRPKELALRKRERELWERHKCEWFGDRWAILWLDGEQEDAVHDTTHAYISRGFVSEVRARQEKLDFEGFWEKTDFIEFGSPQWDALVHLRGRSMPQIERKGKVGWYVPKEEVAAIPPALLEDGGRPLALPSLKTMGDPE